MTKTFKIISFFALIVLLAGTVSCNKKKSLSELRKEERDAINYYISENNLNIIYELPADTVFTNEKDYYHTPSGLYIHISSKGDGVLPVAGNTVSARYLALNLKDGTTINLMNPDNYRDAYQFVYGAGATCTAFEEALGYVGEDGELSIIVPSEIGFKDAFINVYPYFYDIKKVRIR